ncbi:SPOR domain-containing protein [bacterium]|nr:SPOR domain-containing protein [bacterium]
MRSFLFVLCAFAIAWGQTPSATRSNAETLTAWQEDRYTLEESWDPAILLDLTLDTSAVRQQVIRNEQFEALLKGRSRVEENAGVYAYGYRVQLVATREEAEARANMQSALLSFSENVYLLFDNPYYKLRVGDCLSRSQADSLQQRALAKGFANAWITRSQVYKQPPDRNSLISPPNDSLFLHR